MDTAKAEQVTQVTDGVGLRLRQRRKVRQLSLREVAAKANVSVAYLSQIERNLSVPSMRSLTSICLALDMPIGWLFNRDGGLAVDDRDFVVRATSRRRLDFPHMTKELLSTDSVRSLQLSRFVIEPSGDVHEGAFAGADGAKAGVVVSGCFGLRIDGRDYLLEAEDSFSFPATRPYQYWCAGDEPCVLLWATTPAIY